MEVVKFVAAHFQELLNALVAVLTALVALFMLIPGEQPEKTLQKIVDFLSKFSRKPDSGSQG